MYPSRATFEKRKVMKSPSRKLIPGVIAIVGLAIELHRIRAASAIARDDDDHNERQQTTNFHW